MYFKSFLRPYKEKQWYLQCFCSIHYDLCVFLHKKVLKKRSLEASLQIFSARDPPLEKTFLALFLPPLIWTQDGLKSQNTAKMQSISTFV